MAKKIVMIENEEELIKTLGSEIKNSVEEAVAKLQQSSKKEKGEIYLTVDELCQLYRCCRSTIFRMVRKGVLTSYKFGAKTLFKSSEVTNNALIKLERRDYDF